jgi:hypothetical protein
LVLFELLVLVFWSFDLCAFPAKVETSKPKDLFSSNVFPEARSLACITRAHTQTKNPLGFTQPPNQVD